MMTGASVLVSINLNQSRVISFLGETSMLPPLKSVSHPESFSSFRLQYGDKEAKLVCSKYPVLTSLIKGLLKSCALTELHKPKNNIIPADTFLKQLQRCMIDV
jgi:hypothetical protein